MDTNNGKEDNDMKKTYDRISLDAIALSMWLSDAQFTAMMERLQGVSFPASV